MLIIGLGNPGKEYIYTRHNAGFLALDAIADHLGVSWQSKFDADFASINHVAGKLYLLKPNTFMNLSGKSAIAAKHYFKIPNENIVTIHDDIEVQPGSLRYKVAGSSAGHNGIKSLDSSIGKDYHRIRIGVGRPDDRMDPADYVLGKFSNPEKVLLDEIIADIVGNFDIMVSGDFEEFSAKFKK